MKRPTWKATPPTFYHGSQLVAYLPFVVEAGEETHLLALHKDGNWKLSDPQTGRLILEVSSYTLGAHQRPKPSGYLSPAKARQFARKDIQRLILALGPEAFNAAMQGKLPA